MNQQRAAALQDPFLNILRRERIPVAIYLVNGIKLQGQVESFDPFVVLLRNSVSQLIYKHAISTIVPTRPVRVPYGSDEAETQIDDASDSSRADESETRPHERCLLDTFENLSNLAGVITCAGSLLKDKCIQSAERID